jgi:hypothetical protein
MLLIVFYNFLGDVKLHHCEQKRLNHIVKILAGLNDVLLKSWILKLCGMKNSAIGSKMMSMNPTNLEFGVERITLLRRNKK